MKKNVNECGGICATLRIAAIDDAINFVRLQRVQQSSKAGFVLFQPRKAFVPGKGRPNRKLWIETIDSREPDMFCGEKVRKNRECVCARIKTLTQ